MERSITEELVELLKKKDVDFMSLKQLNETLPDALRDKFNLTKKSTVTKVEKAISQYLGDELEIKKISSSKCLTFKPPKLNVTQELVKLLEENNVDFMPLKQLKLSDALKDQLKLTAKPAIDKIEKTILPYLGETLMLKRVSKTSAYLSFKQPDEILLFRIVQKSEGKEPGVKNIPFSGAEYLSLINRLLERGMVRVRLSKDYKPLLYTAKETPLIPKEPNGNNVSEEAFHSAFNKLERGQVFVDIYKLRRSLNWPRNDFDAMICKLRDSGKIQLHAADAIILAADEIADSFIDENSFRMGSVTWH